MLFDIPIWKVIVDAYFVWVLVIFLVKFIISNKKMLNIAISFLFVYIIAYVANLLDLLVSGPILAYLAQWMPVLMLLSWRLTLEDL